MKLEHSVKIDEVSWGEIKIAGKTFKDVKIWPGIVKQWDWNETDTHHNPGIQPEDVKELIENNVEVVVLSQGYKSRLKVKDETIEHIKSKGLSVEVYKTKQAVDRYNKLVENDKRVGALIHSTC